MPTLGQEVQALMDQRNTLLAALRAVYDETREGVRPYSTDSYLPAHILAQVAAAIANATGAARSAS